MSGLDDAKEFSEMTEGAIDSGDRRSILSSKFIDECDDEFPTTTNKKVEPGVPTQYALHGPGYTPTRTTIKSLPPGCYDIQADNHAVFATPAAKPTGLLLELPEMRSDHVISLVNTFWNSEKDYKEGNEFVIGGAAYRAGILVFGPPGCHAKGQGILMHDGTIKKVEDVKVGDLLMGPDSQPRKVLELKRGREEMVRVTPTKGTPFVVNKSHIMHLTPTHKNDTVRCPINMSIRDLTENTSEPFKERHKITRTGVDFPKKELTVPPYILGLWLGDGSSNRPELTTMDKEVADIWMNYGKGLGLETTINTKNGSKASTYTLSSQTNQGPHGRNFVRSKLIELKVMNSKHIPIQYLTSNRQDRLALLAGLIDTDGHCGETAGRKTGHEVKSGYDFISKWEHLANEVVFLCRSLGFAAYVTKCTKGCYVSSHRYFTGEYYRVSISGDLSEVPVVLERKKSSPRKQIKSVLRTGFTFENLPVDNFYGFTLNGDHLYLTDDFTIHHNSGKSCTLKIVSNKLVERGGTVFFASSHPATVMSFLSDFSKIETNRKSIVILEDLDSLIQNFGESTYLEMLDSAKTIDNVLFIATTNYPDRLDQRIYNRPGRFSHVVKIGLPTVKAREAYLKAILKNHRDVPYMVEHTQGFTIDHLTALVNEVYRCKKDLKEEIERLRTLFKMPKSEEDRGIGLNAKIGLHDE